MDFLHSVWTTGGAFLLLLTVVVFVHELGHFLVARWNGVRVEVFSVGFGRELIGFNDRHGTRWRISMLPLGGYVKFFGDADAASAGTDDTSGYSEEERRVAFPCQPLWRKASIVFAGPAANFVFAILVFAVVFMTVGRPQTQAVIDEVRPASAAQEAGLLPGDRIVAVAGEPVASFEDVQRLVPLYGNGVMAVTVDRAGQTLTLETEPHRVDSEGNPLPMPILGVTISPEAIEVVRLGPVEALGEAVVNTYTMTRSTLVALGQMVSGQRGTEELGGPIRIAEFSGQAARAGTLSFVMFIAILSINLGLINLLPVPVLDGGHLALYAIEGLRGRPLGEKAQEVGIRIGLSLVIALMIFATWNDILRLVTG
jgi:regulator of sigma E protease